MPNLSANEITSLYLYGMASPPSNLADETLIRPQLPPNTPAVGVAVETDWYMTDGPGRFALGPLSTMVRWFFSPAAPGVPFVPPGSYTKQALETLFQLTYYGIDFQQYNYDDGNADYTERVFVWNSSAFKLSDRADLRFVVEASGDRYIENYEIVPLVENFDFVTSDPLFQSVIGYLKPRMDPSDIGRKVEITFKNNPNSPNNATYQGKYGQDQYVTDNNNLDVWFNSIEAVGWQAGRLWTETNLLLDDLFQSGVTRFLDDDDRPILYGTTNADEKVAEDVVDQSSINTYSLEPTIIFVEARSRWGMGLGSAICDPP